MASYMYRGDAYGGSVFINSSGNGGNAAQLNPIRYKGYYYDAETGFYYLQSRYYDPSICRFINADDPDILFVSKRMEKPLSLFNYCSNDPVNACDPTGMLEISRTVFSIALDIMLDLIVPQLSGPMDILGKVYRAMLGKAANYSVISKIVKKLTQEAIPKFKGLFSKFFTLVRKAIWKVTGFLISNGTKGAILKILTKISNVLLNSKLSNAIDIILCLCSAGGWIALTVDLIDGCFNGRCLLW